MNLTNVKCFGTEGRRNGINELPENEGSIASMDFKVLQLVEMQILKAPENNNEHIEVQP